MRSILLLLILSVSANAQPLQNSIAAAMSGGLRRGLVAWYKMSEGTGTNTIDEMPNANNGVLGTGASWTNGKIGYGVQFIGSGLSNCITLHTNSPIIGLGTVTICAWVNQSATTSGYRAIYTEDRTGVIGSDRINFALNAGKFCLGGRAPDSQGYQEWRANSAISTGAWHHCAVTINVASNSVILYVDGVAATTESTGTFTGTTFDNAAPSQVLIGADGVSGGGSTLAGVVDDLRIYNRVLSPAEIRRVYLYGLYSNMQSGYRWIAGIGDSIMAGHNGFLTAFENGGVESGNTNFSPMHVLSKFISEQSTKTTNIGHGSYTIEDVDTNVRSHIPIGTVAVVMHAGINNMPAGSWTTAQAALNSLYNYAASIGAFFVIDDIFPRTDADDSKALVIRTWNTNYHTWASGKSYAIVLSDHDTMGQIRASTGLFDDLKSSYDGGDGLHLNTNGVAVWATNIWNVIQGPVGL